MSQIKKADLNCLDSDQLNDDNFMDVQGDLLSLDHLVDLDSSDKLCNLQQFHCKVLSNTTHLLVGASEQYVQGISQSRVQSLLLAIDNS